MKPTLSLDVDLRNPGQFLACCGLLELATRLDPGSLGWFEERRFHLATDAEGVLEKFVSCPAEPDGPARTEGGDEKEEKSPPIMLGEPFHLRLDWWEDESANRAGFKTWSAGMTVPGFFNGVPIKSGRNAVRQGPSMRTFLSGHLEAGPQLLQRTEAIGKPSPFNFDSRLSRNVTIQLGFGSEGVFAFSPAVELLAMVGLQRFRPDVEQRWKSNVYFTWREPLPASVASAVTHGLFPQLAYQEFKFSIIGRDASSRYKAFGAAQLQRTSPHA